MKLCVNCKYYCRNTPPPSSQRGRTLPIVPQPGMALCLHPSTMHRVSLITGRPVWHTDRAAVGRERYIPHIYAIIFNRCGPKGRHFSAMQSDETSVPASEADPGEVPK